MNKTIILSLIGCLALSTAFPVSAAVARVRTKSGRYSVRGRRGTYQRSVSSKPGQRNTTLTTQNQNGRTAQRQSQQNWNRSTGQGTYNAHTTGAYGNTVSRSGTVTKTGNSLTQQGTITGPKGNTADVNRTVTANPGGGHSVDTTYTNAQGQTATVDRNVSYSNATSNPH